jgi:hypothetical protein
MRLTNPSFDESPEEIVDLIERYRLRHAGPE